MTESEKKNREELLNLIQEHPELPIVPINTEGFLTIDYHDPMLGLTVFRRLKEYKPRKAEWSAFDIIMLPSGIMDDSEKIYAILRPELVDDRTMHNLACDFAEHAQGYVDKPVPEALDAIDAKRRWLSGLSADIQPQRDAIRSATLAASHRSDRSNCTIASMAAAWAAMNDVGFRAALDAAHFSTIAAEASGMKAYELRWELNQILSAIRDPQRLK